MVAAMNTALNPAAVMMRAPVRSSKLSASSVLPLVIAPNTAK